MSIQNRLALIATIAYSSVETVHETYRLAKEMQAIDGCFVECGVGAGAQLMAMAVTWTRKDIIGFDSFEGIPLASEHDETQPGVGEFTPADDRLVSSGITAHSVENVLKNFEQFGIGCPTLRLIKGWFQNTLPKFQPVPIALLRLDGDLYESTQVCLQYLYPMVSVGGVVIIDDYALPGCRKAVHEYFGKNMPELHGDGIVWFCKK
jgi:hypothetical protein